VGVDGVSRAIEPANSWLSSAPAAAASPTLLRLLIGFDRPESGSVLYGLPGPCRSRPENLRTMCAAIAVWVLQHNAHPFTLLPPYCVAPAPFLPP